MCFLFHYDWLFQHRTDTVYTHTAGIRLLNWRPHTQPKWCLPMSFNSHAYFLVDENATDSKRDCLITFNYSAFRSITRGSYKFCLCFKSVYTACLTVLFRVCVFKVCVCLNRLLMFVVFSYQTITPNWQWKRYQLWCNYFRNDTQNVDLSKWSTSSSTNCQTAPAGRS